VAQALLNRKPLEEVEVPMDNAKKRYRIDSIAAYQAAPAIPATPAT
jgi:transcription elongation GreA/GreB family factor